MNIEIALKINNLGLKCPCCEEMVNPFEADNEIAEQKVEELKDQLVIATSLKNNNRLFDDC